MTDFTVVRRRNGRLVFRTARGCYRPEASVCCETAICLESGSKQKWLARSQNVAYETLNEHPPDLSSPGLLTNVDL